MASLDNRSVRESHCLVLLPLVFIVTWFGSEVVFKNIHNTVAFANKEHWHWIALEYGSDIAFVYSPVVV